MQAPSDARRTGCAALLALCVGVLGACRDEAGVCAFVSVPAGVAPEQARFSFVSASGASRPDPPKLVDGTATTPLDGGSYCLYVDDSMSGQELSCRIQLLAAGKTVAEGGKTVILKAGEAVRCEPVLKALPAAEQPPDHVDGCADGTREGFLDGAAFPQVAACAGEGNEQVSYQTVVEHAEEQCQAGWHWCTPTEVATLPDDTIPNAVAAQDPCAWLDFQTDSCDTTAQVQFFVGNTTCSFIPWGNPSPVRRESTGPCNLPGDDPRANCSLSWKLALTLKPDEWATVSLFDRPTCYGHVRPACGAPPSAPVGQAKPTTCWVACCKTVK